MWQGRPKVIIQLTFQPRDAELVTVTMQSCRCFQLSSSVGLHPFSGKREEHKLKLSRKGWGKLGMSLEIQGKPTLWWDILGFSQ